jgi:ERCC4-type nuclease
MFEFDLNHVRIPKAPAPAADDSQPKQVVVCPFTVICDSREQLSYSFDRMPGRTPDEILAVPTIVQGLPSGDYSIEGMEELIAIERKSLDDAYGSVTWGRRRFEAEIGRLDEMPGFAAVVIEADWREIVSPADHRPGWENQTDPRSVVGTINAWSIRYPRVHWLACGSRREAEIRTFQILQAAWKEWQGRAG